LHPSVFPCMCPKKRRWSESGVPGGEALLRCGAPRGVVECVYECVLSIWAPDILDGESTIRVMPLFYIWSCTDLESTVEEAWECVSCTWGESVTWQEAKGCWAALSRAGRCHQVGPDPPATSTCLLLLDIWQFCIVFLREQRSPCTSGNRWIININHYLSFCFLPCLV
jgi:hypothetical protein